MNKAITRKYTYPIKTDHNTYPMKKLLTLTALAALMLLTACRTDKRTSQTADSFIDDLMAQMTLEEKLGQLNLPVARDIEELKR